MIPELFRIGPIPLIGIELPVHSFGLMVALAFFALIHRLSISFKHNGIDPDLAEKYVFVGGISGLVGSRLWFLLEESSNLKGHFLEMLFSTSGFTFFGGFIFSTVIVIICCCRDKLPFDKFFDSLGPALTLGYAIGRVGCQLSGDGCYGVQTKSMLGMAYPTGVIPTEPGVLVFPTPFFESLICIGILFVLVKLERQAGWQKPFMRFGTYLLLIASERFFVEFIRINPDVVGIISQAQIISILIFTVGALLLLYSGCLRGKKKL
jgi:phosphatidylglycerol---prolipoprotein diacylglyceryl transferase